MIVTRWYRSFKDQIVNDREFSLFLLVSMFLGLAGGIYNTIFPNFLHDIWKVDETTRGFLEFPRESAGLIVLPIIGLLSFLGDIRTSRLTMILNVVGLFGMALLSPTYAVMAMWLFIFSLGQHVFMPLTPKIGMTLSKRENYGMRLARYGAYGLVAGIIGNGIAWVGWQVLHLGYTPLFIISGVFFACASVAMFMMKSDKPAQKPPKFIFRKQYSLYYALCLSNGARKQIFLTFAPWVLIQVFKADVATMAILGVVVSVVSVGTRTIVGRAIDTLGERKVLTFEACLLLLICFGYAVSGNIFSTGVTFVIIAACYIIDSSSSVVDMARSTYMRKIAVKESDITPTLSAGVSLDHIMSMSIPALGGLLWAATGYESVFFVAAGIAVLNIVLTSRIKIKKAEADEIPAPAADGIGSPEAEG